jgi:hypothetical protein
VQRVFYSGGSFLTSDHIAAALMDYATALATSRTADLVHIPTVDEVSTRQSVASLVLGPASHLLALPVDVEGLIDPIDTEIVEELHRRTRLVDRGRRMPEAFREGVARDGLQA